MWRGREGIIMAKTHGMTDTPTYNSWAAMRKRCLNKRHHAYARYGGKGITICERWGKLENFLSNMGERPEGTTLDRINNDGNYEPGNCRWASWSEQQNNRGNMRMVTINGATKSLSEWSQRSGIPISTIFNRLGRGWPSEFILSKRNHRNNSPMSLKTEQ